ncbi:hypothetical protein JQC91_07215 [Jannaschia sp. Os4]|uniref:hypothetical protein n=1 Tax=Jannaschia sp. Os4 TaxID=2807617 RepID=UPI00193938C8|nr:hypothetical protein [Jannaschia sp. Os4]MBM2576090.1 hypothetical protein [Jannaschia sp. Os4]
MGLNFLKGIDGNATVEFGILAAAVGTVGLVAATLMAAPGPSGTATAQQVQLTDIEATSFAPPSYRDSGSYRSFRVMIDGMEEADVLRLYDGLPASFEVRLGQGDIDGAAEVIDALQALDDTMRARDIERPEHVRDTTEALIERLAAAKG